ncbi:MAG: biotin/lipoyl-binding protein, partial [Hyphomicrobiaceae bacterium]
MKRRLLIGAVATVLLSAAAAWWWFSRAPQNSPLMLTGNVEVRQVNLGFKVAGRIKGLKVDEGDTIAEGQVLAGLERVYFEDDIAQLKAQRDQAQANLAKLEAGNRPEEIAQAEATVAERDATAANTKIAFDRAD